MVLDRTVSGKLITLEHADIIYNYSNLRDAELGNNYFSTFDGSGWNKTILPDRFYTVNDITEKT